MFTQTDVLREVERVARIWREPCMASHLRGARTFAVILLGGGAAAEQLIDAAIEEVRRVENECHEMEGVSPAGFAPTAARAASCEVSAASTNPKHRAGRPAA